MVKEQIAEDGGYDLVRYNKDKDEEITKMRIERNEIENYLAEHTLLEQGCVRFDSRIYISTLYFKKIDSNYKNMQLLIKQRANKYKRKMKGSGADGDDDELF